MTLSAPQTDFSIVADRGRLVMAAYGRLFIAGWNDAPTPETLWDLRAAGMVEEERRGPMALLNIAFAGRPSFSDDVRRAARRLTSDAELFRTSRAHVVLLSGIPGATVRAFVNTFIRLARPPIPTKMLGSVRSALRWTAQHLEPDRLDERATLAALANFERRVIEAP